MEDSSVLNSVFFEYMKKTNTEALQDMIKNLKHYIKVKLKGNSKTARLGLTTEKELFNICTKLFSNNSEFKLSPEQRRLLSIVWSAI